MRTIGRHGGSGRPRCLQAGRRFWLRWLVVPAVLLGLLVAPAPSFAEVPAIDSAHMTELVEWVYRNDAGTDPEPCGTVCNELWSEQGGVASRLGGLVMSTGMWGTYAELASHLTRVFPQPGGSTVGWKIGGATPKWMALPIPAEYPLGGCAGVRDEAGLQLAGYKWHPDEEAPSEESSLASPAWVLTTCFGNIASQWDELTPGGEAYCNGIAHPPIAAGAWLEHVWWWNECSASKTHTYAKGLYSPLRFGAVKEYTGQPYEFETSSTSVSEASVVQSALEALISAEGLHGPLQEYIEWVLRGKHGPNPSGGGAPLPGEMFGPGPESPSGRPGCYEGKSVNCASGNETKAQTDLQVKGRGPQLNLVRTYNSQLAVTQSSPGHFGYGWTGSFGAHVVLDPGTEVATVYGEDGSSVGFRPTAAGWVPISPLAQVTLTEEGGHYVFTRPDQTKLRFGSGGYLSTETDRNGNVVTVHGPEGHPESVSDAAGRVLKFTYTGELVTSATDPMGHVVKFAYEEGNLVSVTEPGETAATWQFKYDSQHEMTSETDGRGDITEREYDGSHRVISEADPLHRKYKWEYTGLPETEGKVTKITEPNGAITREEFNASVLPVAVTRAYGTALAVTALDTYDASGHLINRVQAGGHLTSYTYDAQGNRSSEVDPNGNKTEWAYDSAHDVISQRTPDGETTTIKRDSHGNAETVERPAPGSITQSTKYKYAANGDLESMEDPLKRVTKYEYDSYGDRTAETDPEGDKRTWGYNEDSQQVSVVSPRGHLEGAEPAKFTTTIERDAQGRPVLITEPVSTGASKPVSRAAAGISGVAREGQVLVASAGVWEGTPTLSFGYQWQHCTAAGGECAAISGATESKYVLVHGDVGFTMRLVVTATSSLGSAVSTSAATAPVVAVVPVLLSAFGSGGSENGQFSAPRGAAIAKNGNVLVLDTSNNRVEEFSQAGKYESKFGTLGSGNGQLKAPYGIAVDSKGNVWVTDWGNNRVEEFNEKYEFLRTFGWGVTDAKAEFEICTVSCKAGIAGTGAGQFKEPKGIAVTAAGRVYVSDAANNRVETFKEKGEFLATFGWGVTDAKSEFEVCSASCKVGLSGSGNGQFNGVRGVAVTPTGNVWVVESSNNRVQEFNEANEYVLKFGSSGTGAGQFKEPKGIVYTASGNVVVANEGNWRVEMFSAAGTFLATFGAKGTGSGQFEEPSGIAMAANENVYVVDAKLNRVEQWEPIPASAVYVAQFGSKGSENGQFSEPHGAAVAKNGNLLVVDSSNNRVEEFSPAGKYEGKFGTLGSGNGQFKAPYGIAVDSKGNEWVTDTVNNRVEEFNEKNEFLRTIGWGVADAKTEFEICTISCKAGLAGSGTGQLKEPRGIAVNAAGNVYVSESPNSRVDIFKEKGEFLSTFGWGVTDAKSELETCTTACKAGLAGSGNGQFNGLRGMTITPAGNVWVIESTNNRVQEFNAANEYVLKFGTSGTGSGQFKEPKGIAYTQGGNVLVADEGNARVQAFTTTGAFLSTFGTKGTGTGQLEEPSGLALTSNENVYVVDFKNNRVQQWRPAGAPSNAALPAISGELLLGQTLTASTGTWSAVPEAGYSYQWQRCNRTGAECSSIAGATGTTHVLVTADTGKTLRAVVTATNSAGSAEATSPTSDPAQGPRTTEYTYDANGNIESITDPNANKTKYVYDADNEQTKVELPNGTTTETGYDTAGRITSQTDGSKHITEYTRNLLERVTEVIDPLKRKTLEEYDAAGNLTKLTDPLKRVTTNTYNEANRLTEMSYSDGITHAVKYEYNGDGLPTKMTDGTGETINIYDQLDRLTESQNGHAEKVKYEYDLANEQTKVTYPNTKAITRAFDKDGRLESITDWLSSTTKLTYDANSNLTATTFPSATGDEDKYTYNEADQMTEVKMSKGAETLATLGYTGDNSGQVKSNTQTGLPGEPLTNYEYDQNSRLAKAGPTSYEYDPANNPTKQGTNAYTFSNASELETGPSTTKYTYNEQGQRTKTTPATGPATSYGYDQAGNLKSVTRPEEGATPKIEDSYAYDGSSLRASQTINGTTTYMAWDANERMPLLLTDGTNSYIYGPSNFAIEQINNSTGAVTYLHHDQAGSTRLLTSSTGAKEASFTYDAYGNTTGTTGTAKTPLGYDAQYTSSDTGLIYMRHRVYDPTTAQFLTVDPAVSITGAPYNYALDNPVNWSDPSGLEAIPFPAAPVAGPCAVAPEACAAAALGGADIYLGVKVFNAWGGSEEAGNDEGQSELEAKQEGEEAACDPATPPGSNFEWKGNGDPGSEEGSWFDPESREYLRKDFKPSSHGPHYDYRAPDGSRWRIYPDGRIEPKP